MGILGNLFGMSEDNDIGARIALASQALMALDQGQVPNIAPALIAMNERRRRIADDVKAQKWLQNQAASMADKNPRLAQMLQDAPPEVGQGLIAQYIKTLPEFQLPDWKTFESGGDVMRYDANNPNSKPEVFFDGPAPAPTGEMAQYENDQQMRAQQGLPRQSFAEWNVSTLAPPKPAEWENKYNAMVADMKRRGVPEDQIPTLSEFLDDGLKIVTSPDGSVSVTQGGAASTARPTEGDYRAKQIAQSIAADIPEAIQGFSQMSSFAGTLDDWNAGFLNDEDSQAAMDAIKNVATQAVYAISGAGTTESEMSNKIASMTPAPGDKPKTLKNKKRRLIATIKSMTDRANVAPADLGFDPSIFDLEAAVPPKTDAEAPGKKMIWTPDGGLQEVK